MVQINVPHRPDLELVIVNKFLRYLKCPESAVNRGLLAGFYISLGAILMSLAKDAGYSSIVCGFNFSVGLFLVIVAGGELFTGNCLIDGLLLTKPIDRATYPIYSMLITNYFTNVLGCFVAFALLFLSGFDCTTLGAIAAAKLELPLRVLFVRAVFCNILVCLAVWMASYISNDDSMLGKFIAVSIPVTIFVACGFEHSIADVFIFMVGNQLGTIDLFNALIALIVITVGNWIGGVGIGLMLRDTIKEF